MPKRYSITWTDLSKALTAVLRTKTDQGVINAILEDFEEELDKRSDLKRRRL